MKITILTPLAAAGAFLTISNSMTYADVTVKAVGIQVVSETYGDPEDFSSMIAPLNSQNGGTVVALFVKSAEGGLLGIDGNDSKLESFTDSGGNNLLMEKKVKFSMQGIRSYNRISKDGKVASVEIHGNGVPASGSTHIAAKGEIAVTMATEKKSLRSEPAELQKGSVFKAGDTEFTVKKSGKPEFGDDAFSVELSFKGSVESIAAYRIIDKDGKAHELNRSGYSSFGMGGGKASVDVTLTSETAITAGSLEIDLWVDLKKVKVPFEVKAGVGLGE